MLDYSNDLMENHLRQEFSRSDLILLHLQGCSDHTTEPTSFPSSLHYTLTRVTVFHVLFDVMTHTWPVKAKAQDV